MAKPVIYGPAYSTYVRSVRLVLEEKGVDYDLHHVDIFSGEIKHPDHVARHPWGKVPAFEHDGFQLYETEAIMRYCDLAFGGPSLQPDNAKGQGRMTQLINIVDGYAYGPLIGNIVIQRLVMPKLEQQPDEAAIQNAIEPGRTAVSAMDQLIAGEFAVGSTVTLADCHMLPVIDYLALTEEGKQMMANERRLSGWFEKFRQRDSVTKTAPEL
jgi:glutathione S-transferase